MNKLVTLCWPNWYSITVCRAYSLTQNAELTYRPNFVSRLFL